MKSFPIFLALIVSLCILGGCKKTELTGEYADFVGGWYGINMYISFTPDGRATYAGNESGPEGSMENARVIIDGNSLKLKKGVVTKKFRISSPPKETSNGQWQMNLSGRILTRS